MSLNAATFPLNDKLVRGFVFLLYIGMLAIGMSHHELWGDELHSWNIAKASGSFIDLLRNSQALTIHAM